ncbi:hypothetical protein [Neolewinella persica]|uniref:hypothetical protein n=1 Tax=Neolewinella persica TaxID=70998 RepID=UPI00036638C7|nr:hypothetical protein [Neolewinella persica]
MSFDPLHSAQVAHGKFHLHPWEGQVLVDWAVSMVQHGFDQHEMVQLSEMEGKSRELIHEAFLAAAEVAGINLPFTDKGAISTYLLDLRDRVLSNEIDAEAAFAQVRPLAYDTEGVQLTGLSELDEDLNLVDSGELPWHHADLTSDNRDVLIRRFFRRMRVIGRRTVPAGSGSGRSRYYVDNEFSRYIEIMVIIYIGLLTVIYVLSLIASFL